ncbi:MAG: hypothetical protein ABIH80_01045, partial [Methanobacteriota archaeon]
PDEMVQEMPESSRNKVVEEYITGVGMLETKLIILLDVNRMLESGVKETEAIRQAIGDIQSMKTQPPEKKERQFHEEETKMVEKEQTARRKGKAKAIKEV